MERRTLLLVLALLSIVAFSSGALPPLPELQTREELRQFIAESNQGARLLFVTTDNRDCVLCPAQEKALRTTAGIEGANFKIAKYFMTDDRLRILREEGQIDRTGGIFFEAENQLKIPALIYFRDGIPR